MLKELLDNLSQLCLQKNVQICTAESCTGGLVAKLITDCAGSSQWFERGFVTYSNLSKEQMLGVDSGLLKQWGAVSEPVAVAMAEGALKHSQVQYSLSITGVAGPDGGTKEKPVGLVCFGWAWRERGGNGSINSTSSSQLFSGDREAVRTQSALFSLQYLQHLLLEENSS